MIAALTKSERENHHRGLYLSATSLGKCDRQIKIERTKPFADFMKNRLWAYRGTVIHQVTEDAADLELETDDGKKTLLDLGYLVEWRMLIGFCEEHGGFQVPDSVSPYDESTWDAVTCPHCDPEDPKGHSFVGEEGGPCDVCGEPLQEHTLFLLGGTLDGLEPIWSQFDAEAGVLPVLLWDMKTQAEFALTLFITGQDHKFNHKNKYHPNVKDGYVEQANIYRYMGERSRLPDALREKGVKKVRFMSSEIQAFGMKDFPKTGSEYPYKKHWKQDEKLWWIPSIEFWPDEDVEAFIRVNGHPVRESLIQDLNRGKVIEPEERKGQHHWLCGLCAFQESENCPDPALEWKLMKEEGYSVEEAYEAALTAWEEEDDNDDEE